MKKAKTDIFTKTYLQKHKLFKKALQDALLMEMKNFPNRFFPKLRTKKYSREFAEHFLTKVKEGKVVVINETVATACRLVGAESLSVTDLYALLEIALPEQHEPRYAPKKTYEEESFRGC